MLGDGMMKEKKFTAVILAIVTVIVIGTAYYYVELPAINIHLRTGR